MNGNNNYTPLAVFGFFASALFLALGLFLFFGDVDVTSYGLIESPIVNKIICLIIMLGISLFFLLCGIGYLRKTREYFREKKAFDNEYIDISLKDDIAKRTCPKCGKSHDIDYPKCPRCKFDYNK